MPAPTSRSKGAGLGLSRFPRAGGGGGLKSEFVKTRVIIALQIRKGKRQRMKLERGQSKPILAAAFYSSAPSLSSVRYSSSLRPMISRRKRSVCWPSRGAGASRLPGVRDSSNSLRSVA